MMWQIAIGYKRWWIRMHNFWNGKKYSSWWFYNVKQCHYVKVWIIIVHDHAILKVSNIESLKKMKKEKVIVILYYIRSGFEYFILIRLFQMVSYIFIIYLKHYHIILILKMNNFSTNFNIKIQKIKHWLHLLWFL